MVCLFAVRKIQLKACRKMDFHEPTAFEVTLSVIMNRTRVLFTASCLLQGEGKAFPSPRGSKSTVQCC
jgi:hypothetical protein